MLFRKSSVGKKIVPSPKDWRDSFITCPRGITMRVCIPLTCDVYSQIPPSHCNPAGKKTCALQRKIWLLRKKSHLVVYSPHPGKDSSYKIRTRTIRNSQPKNSMYTSRASNRQKKNRPRKLFRVFSSHKTMRGS